MEVSISIAEIKYQAKKASEQELDAVYDNEQTRYKYFPGEEKADLLQRCLEDACSELELGISRFLDGARSISDKTIPATGTTVKVSVVYALRDSRRRLMLTQDGVSNTIFSFLCEETLALFYSKVGCELADAHGKNASTILSNLVSSLYQKTAPII